MIVSIGGSKGAPGTPPHRGPKSLIFMQFSGKILQNNRLAHPFKLQLPNRVFPIFDQKLAELDELDEWEKKSMDSVVIFCMNSEDNYQ